MSRFAIVVLTISCLVLGLGCRKKPVTAPAPARDRASAPAPTRTERPPIARERVNEFLATWLRAQNERKFDAYEALYATRFDGVRRTRRRTVRLDRAGWMADRRRMFERPIQVSASDVVVRTTPRTADVEFTQRWSSGSYSDVGRKRMWLVEENGALRISIEEMLAARRPAPIEEGLASAAWFTLATVEGTYVVLGEAPASLATGPARLASREDPRIALRKVSASAPEGVRSMVGTRVRVGACEATVTELAIGAVVVPHFGVDQEWADEDFDEATVPRPAGDAKIAEDVFALTETHALLARLDRPCEGELATRENGHVAFLAERSLDDATRERLLAAFEARPENRDARTEFERDEAEAAAEGARPESWRETLHVHVWDVGDDAYVGVTQVSRDSCRVLTAHSSLYLDANGVLTLVGDVDSAWNGTIELVDVDGDAAPEVIVTDEVGTRVLYRIGPALVPITRSFVDYQDCPC